MNEINSIILGIVSLVLILALAYFVWKIFYDKEPREELEEQLSEKEEQIAEIDKLQEAENENI